MVLLKNQNYVACIHEPMKSDTEWFKLHLSDLYSSEILPVIANFEDIAVVGYYATDVTRGGGVVNIIFAVFSLPSAPPACRFIPLMCGENTAHSHFYLHLKPLSLYIKPHPPTTILKHVGSAYGFYEMSQLAPAIWNSVSSKKSRGGTISSQCLNSGCNV